MKLLFTIDEETYRRSMDVDNDLLLFRIWPTNVIRNAWVGNVKLHKPSGEWLQVEAEIVVQYIDLIPEQWPGFGCNLKKIAKSDIEIGTTVWSVD